jgi:hypothetical protein
MQTIVKRKAKTASSNSAYMKSSAVSRTSIRLQQNCDVFPPLMLDATIEACRSMPGKKVEMVFAPTEADSLVAEIATEREEGYALSKDSDYFVLCARGKCCPYVPLDSIEYLVKVPPKSDSSNNISQAEGADDFGGDFLPVKGRKRIRKDFRAHFEVSQSADVSQRIDTIPPSSRDEEKLSAVSIRAYRPQDLASHLQIPPTLLPVLAALVGNDFTTTLQSNVLFKQFQGSRRISEAASILRSEWVKATKEGKNGARESRNKKSQSRLPLKSSWNEDNFDDAKSDTFSSAGSSAMATPTRYAPEPPRSSTNAQDPVRAMISAIVEKAISQMDASNNNPRYVPTGEKDLIVESVIDSVATYSLLTHSDAPHLTSPSALFFGQPSSLLVASANGTITSPEAVERYRQAYDQGHFTPTLIEALTRRVFISTLFAEDADVKSVSVLEAREIRSWLWSILFEAWGMDWARTELIEEAVPNEVEDSNEDERKMAAQLSLLDRGYKEGEKPDDIISVDTESSHSIVLDDNKEGNLDDLPSRPGSVAELHRNIDKPAPDVVEYVRRAHQYTGEPVPIYSLQKLLQGELLNEGNAGVSLPSSLSNLREKDDSSTPPALMPLETRLDLYLHAHRSCTPAIHALDRPWWPIAATLRLAIQYQARLLGPTKRKLNWSREELIAALQSASHAKSTSHKESDAIPESAFREVLPSTRAIHLSSTLQLLLETSHLLAQSLLLPIDISEWPQPHSLYHGPTFHHQINEISKEEDRPSAQPNKELNTVLKAIIAGLEDDLGIDISELKKERKAKKKEAKEKEKVAVVPVNGSKKQAAARNAFALLGDDNN